MIAIWLLVGMLLGWIVRVQVERAHARARMRAFIRRDVERGFDEMMVKLAREGNWIARVYLHQHSRKPGSAERQGSHEYGR